MCVCLFTRCLFKSAWRHTFWCTYRKWRCADKDGCTRTVTDKSRKNKHRMTNGKKHADQVEPFPPMFCLFMYIKTSKSKLIWPLSPNTSYFLIDKCSHLPPTSSILSHFSYSLPLPFFWFLSIYTPLLYLNWPELRKGYVSNLSLSPSGPAAAAPRSNKDVPLPESGKRGNRDCMAWVTKKWQSESVYFHCSSM